MCIAGDAAFAYFQPKKTGAAYSACACMALRSNKKV